jgi:hypothetical protein
MIELEKEKIWTGDSFGASGAITLRQEKVHRFPAPINKRSGVAMYSRWKKDGSFGGYEVFQIKITPKGHKCFQAIVEEDTEKYPTCENFGFWAWHIWNKPHALEVFQQQIDKLMADELMEDGPEAVEDETEIVPVARVETPFVPKVLVIPSGEFTTVQFGLANNLPVPGKGYTELKSLQAAGKVKEVARRKVKEGPGKPTTFFMEVA